MKAILISCFGYYELRLKHVEKVLQQRGYEVKVVFSNFDHILKKTATYENKNLILVDVPSYKKNISFKRMFSHLMFSHNLNAVLKTEKPDLIYALVPPNTIARSVIRYKEANINTKVIFDVFDLWPESFPIGTSKFPLFIPWKNIRNKALKKADYVFLECEYYRKYINEYLPMHKNDVLYLSKSEMEKELTYNIDSEQLNFCYLGSINHIIDIDAIVSFLVNVKKNRAIKLHIIGDGENKTRFLDLLDENNINYQFYGKVFDDNEKSKIFQECHFGINMYTENVVIGLTMKSLDYFQVGLPTINMNIYDTGHLVEEYQSGYNLNNERMENVVAEISSLTLAEWNEMHINTLKMFNELFSSIACEGKLNIIFDDLLV